METISSRLLKRDPYLARFKRSAFLPRRRRHFLSEKNPLFPPRAKETSYIRLLRLVETTSILLQLGWKKLKEGFTLEEWLPRDHFYIFHENVPLLHPTIMYNERKLH